jgi:hypothetical protein
MTSDQYKSMGEKVVGSTHEKLDLLSDVWKLSGL